MITFADSPITTLVQEALQHQPLDAFAQSVVDQLASSEGFSTEQKLGVQIVTDRLVRQNMTVQHILEYVTNGDWTTGSVAVTPLSAEQRAGIILAIVGAAKAVLTTKANELDALAEATYEIPEEPEEPEEPSE